MFWFLFAPIALALSYIGLTSYQQVQTDFANRELNDNMDYPDALHFARKGLAAAAGETVMPEPIADWNLLPRHMEELSTARGRLIVALDLGAREIAPQPAAIPQRLPRMK